MTSKNQDRNLKKFYLLIVIILLIILAINIHKQCRVLEEIRLSPKTIWKEVVTTHQIDKDLNLIFVRSSGLFFPRTYEYLYHRKYTPEDIASQLNHYLEGKRINIGEITISKTGGDVRLKLISENKPFASVICTPNMSTYAGKICIIIDDFGYNLNAVVKEFLQMDADLTYSVLPGHTYSKQFAKLADDAGYEVMIHMPMDSKDHRVGEENYLIRRNFSRKEIGERMRMALIEIPQAQGMNNHQGSDATESKRVMKAMAQVLRSEGKYFVDSRTTPKSVVVSEMERAGVLVTERSVFIDFEDNYEIVQKQMTLLEEKVREKGFAIGIGHPRKNTLDVLKDEIPKLKQKGFNFVFASSIVK
ncbi:MAG: divergent polysaccharide deacetylase family protein [Candidatus Marinimicrobia bacterium]|nr:divergent polysaccharide deacetylase family protein [Candidatus Neomarinimicrobiota bacterium]